VLLGVGLVLVALAGGALTLVEARRETPPAPVAVTPPPVITALPAPSEPTAHASAGDMWSARRSVPITMYTTTWCPACKKARAWMNREGISYRERDVEASPEAHAEMRRLNPGGGVPTLDIDGEVLVGFDSHGIDQAIQSAADRRLRRR
jgi:glutaredoxin